MDLTVVLTDHFQFNVLPSVLLVSSVSCRWFCFLQCQTHVRQAKLSIAYIAQCERYVRDKLLFTDHRKNRGQD